MAAAGAHPYPLVVRRGLSLELQHPDFAVEYFALIERNLPRLARWEPWANDPHTLGTTRTYLAWQAQAFVSRTQLPFVIVLDGKAVGSCTARLDATNGSAEIGYWVGAEVEGTGVAAESIAALVKHVFARGDTARVQARTSVENVRSRALLERLGFAFEGVQRSSMPMPGGRVDMAVYAKITNAD